MNHHSGVALTLVGALSIGCGDVSSRFMSIGTGGTGGIYYPLGGWIASRLSAADSVRQFTAEVTGGSVENINRIVAGEMDLGFTMATNAYEAFHRGGPDASGFPSLRLVAPMYPNLVHVVVRVNSGLDSIPDFRGQRISVGSAGSGTEEVVQHVLAAHGLSYDDIDERFLSFRESADALRDGAIDGAIIAAGYPTAAVLEVATAGMVRVIGVSQTRRSEMEQSYPYYQSAELPAGAYPGIERGVQTIAVMNWIVADERLDGAVVDLLLTVLDSERDRLSRVHAVGNQIDLSLLGQRTPIPLHPAAEQWFRSR